MLEFIRTKSQRKPAAPPQASPLLNDEDERFFGKFAGEETPPPLPSRPGSSVQTRGKDAQVALMDGAERVALPSSPDVDAANMETSEEQLERAIEETRAEVKEELGKSEKAKGKEKAKEKAKEAKPKRPISSYFSLKRKKSGKTPEDQATLSPASEEAAKEAEANKEADDLTAVLDNLNLSAVNNRTFSISKESQKLLEQFNQCLKDVIHGAPTAYEDLEKLFDRSEGQLTKMYEGMPPFLQSLVKTLPAKVLASFAPELLAATAEKPEEHLDVHNAKHDPLYEIKGAAKRHAKKKAKSTVKIPTLQSLLSKEGAIAAMLRTILNFLKLRFPALLTGTNVLLSMALFILMFVLWYCHKRGREVRLEREGADALSDASDASSMLSKTEGEAGGPSASTANLPSAPTDAPGATTTAAPATVHDMPSVHDLPSPAPVPSPGEGPK